MTAALIIAALAAFLVIIFLASAVKVAREYERGVVFRLGRLLDPPKGRGSSCSSRSSTGWCASTCERSR